MSDTKQPDDRKRPDVDPVRSPTPEEESKEPVENIDEVDEAMYETFPASDPPSYSRGTASKKKRDGDADEKDEG